VTLEEAREQVADFAIVVDHQDVRRCVHDQIIGKNPGKWQSVLHSVALRR
jgi:hypothetical protein